MIFSISQRSPLKNGGIQGPVESNREGRERGPWKEKSQDFPINFMTSLSNASDGGISSPSDGRREKSDSSLHLCLVL